jgi:4-hydroxyphenylacetate 3-monooxygenase
MSSFNMRNGRRYLSEIAHDGRHVVYDGDIVRDVTAHKAFAGAARSYAGLWDIAAAEENRELMTWVSPKTGEPVLRAYQIPRTCDDLRRKRQAVQKWCDQTFGLMGRTADFGAELFTGFAARADVFAAGEKHYADNLVAFHEQARDRHWHISYSIVPPRIDKSKPLHAQPDPDICAHVVRERDDGIVLRGAQQLATGAIYSDYLFLSCINPLDPGDEKYAFSVVMPIASAGLKLLVRRSYATIATSAFDYPLSSRFDETDALVVLDDLFIPWEHVFLYRDIVRCRQQWTRTPAHVYGKRQAQIRYATKLRFLLGVMKHHCEITGVDSLPASQSQLGEMAALASIVDMMLDAQETRAGVEDGVLWPCRAAVYAIMALQSDINPRLIDLARELSGGAMIMVPSSHLDHETVETANDIERYLATPRYTARLRVALLKLAWDLIGTEFAGRQQQYEKFYAGPSFVNKLHMYRNYDFASAKRFAEAALADGN